MTFTYTEDLTIARDYVRFHSGDTVEASSFLSDAIIASLITLEGSNDAAVIAALRYIITKLSQPDFKADWLQVSNSTAREGYQYILGEKKREFGLSDADTGSVHTYRKDSYQTEEPTYDPTTEALESGWPLWWWG